MNNEIPLSKLVNMDLISVLLNKNKKVSIEEAFVYSGLDIIHDARNKFFWNTHLEKIIKVDENLLNWAGYKGEYMIQKKMFKKLLKKNPEIEYTSVKDEIDEKNQKTYIVLKWQDFESLLMQMRSEKSIEIRKIFSKIKELTLLYMSYEKEYEKNMHEIVKRQNSELLQKQDALMLSVQQLTGIVTDEREQAKIEQEKLDSERKLAEFEREKAEEARKLAIERESKAEFEREKAEREREKADLERKLAKEREEKASYERLALQNVIKSTKSHLINVIAPLTAPHSINSKKMRCLGLYSIGKQKWYIIRRQKESFRDGERALQSKHPYYQKIWYWKNISHAVDIGNQLKNKFRYFKWDARGNIITTINLDITDEIIKQIIQSIIDENESTQLSIEL